MSINLVQKFVAEVDSQELLIQYLRLGMTTALESCEEVAVKVLDHTDEHIRRHLGGYPERPMYFPVILIEGWFRPDQGKKHPYFRGWGPWTAFGFEEESQTIEAVADHVVVNLLNEHDGIWNEQFRAQYYREDPNYYSGFDGGIAVGYEIRKNRSFPSGLTISLTHILYGK